MFKRFFRSRPTPVVPYKLGQPTFETRNHILPKAGDLTPGITALEYYERRLKLIKELPAKSISILVGNNVKYASGSVFYDFQQSNNLFYMTGWLEPNSVAVLEKTANNGEDDDLIFHMLVPEKNPSVEIWEGERSGLQGCYEFFNPDNVEDIKNVRKYISDLIKRNDYIYYDKKLGGSYFENFFQMDENEDTITNLLKSFNKKVQPLLPLIAKHREIKSPSEIAVLHKAGRISSRAINKAIAQTGSEHPIQSEKSLGAYLQYEFIKGGCDKQAYIPVVAGGENSLIIHYTRNDDLLYKDELVFVDAGGKLGGYCADISRTWPNSGTFTEPQKDIYEIVLNVNKSCIEKCHQSNEISMHELHDFSVNKLHSNLKNLPGFQSISRSDLVRHLYPHYIGHHLGLDLHDIPSVSKFKKLVHGNVITIEPGLYIPKDPKWPKHYQGIGVRVEDDIVVGKDNKDILNLTSLCVKEVKDIESLISKAHCSTPGAYDELVDIHIDEL